VKKGVSPYCFSRWVHRKYGDVIIHRMRKDGVVGCSIPCVLCKRAMERKGLQWIAFDGTRWVHSLQTEDLPVSRPTSKQKRFIFSRSE
jgi:hypothetical protein